MLKLSGFSARSHFLNTHTSKYDSVVSRNCSSFWLPANGSCYHISGDSLSYYDAEVVCFAYGGMLVEIDSQAKQDSIAELLKQQAVRVTWVSGKVRNYEPEFVWLRGLRPVTYTNWTPGHPIIPRTHERCVFLKKRFGYRWRSHSCDIRHRYICEKVGSSSMTRYLIGAGGHLW